MKAIIIDDETLARQLLKNYIEKHDGLELLAECENGFEGVKAINSKKPDLIFLDIQMPKLNGFEMLELLDYSPQVIFTTAFDEYALQAFDKNAIDYLLKPFAYNRFEQAVQKASDKFKDGKQIDLPKVKEDYKPDEKLNRIAVKQRSNIELINVDDIFFLEAQDDYVNIVSSKGNFLKQATMSYYENHLNENDFVRIHRSTIINVNYLEKIELLEKESYLAIMKDGKKLSISKSGYSKIKNLLGK